MGEKLRRPVSDTAPIKYEATFQFNSYRVFLHKISGPVTRHDKPTPYKSYLFNLTKYFEYIIFVVTRGKDLSRLKRGGWGKYLNLRDRIKLHADELHTLHKVQLAWSSQGWLCLLERIHAPGVHGVELCGSGGGLVPKLGKSGDWSLGLLKAKTA